MQIQVKSSQTFNKIFRYGLVGTCSALVHGYVLWIMVKLLPLWESNVLAFLSASFFSYIGHSIFTFRKETLGRPFARRWLVIQFILNLIVSGLLPILLIESIYFPVKSLLLIIAPTILNACIWNQAAKFSFKRQRLSKSIPLIHADDLGLSEETNKAIFSLAKSSKLNSVSLLVNGNAVESAIVKLKQYDHLKTSLHLCLTEGPPIEKKTSLHKLINEEGILSKSFLNLLFLSLLPNNSHIKKSINVQLRSEIIAQIERYRSLTGCKSVAIDGHQHIHLVPIIFNIIIDLSENYNITWIRSTREMIPIMAPLKSWTSMISNNGLLKWGILQILTILAIPRIKKKNIKTNSGFSGILFTGNMSKEIILNSIKYLKNKRIYPHQTQPIILSHPSAPIGTQRDVNYLSEFPLSKEFATSKFRQIEWSVLENLQDNC